MPKNDPEKQPSPTPRVPTVTLPNGEVRELFTASDEIMRLPSNFRVVDRAAAPPAEDTEDEQGW